MNHESEVVVRVTRKRELADEWALVLLTEGLSPSVWHAADGYSVGVPPAELDRAANVLAVYESETPAQPRLPADESASGTHVYVALAASAGLLAFFLVTGVWDPATRWFAHGAADAERILLGEWWRAVTALTLHADLRHALANAIASVIFLGALSLRLGVGLACAIVLLAGAGGNLVNALVHGAAHVSVGASTSLFGALGVLGALGVARRRRSGIRGRYAWVPIAAGFALLAMLGTSGERVDLWAHFFGFVIGAVLGATVAVTVARNPGVRVQWILGSAALTTVVVSWLVALR